MNDIDWTKWIFILAIIILIITIPLAIHNGYKRDEWLKENCKIIGKVSPSSTIGFGISSNGSNSIIPIFIPGKTGYVCKDGMQYWE